MISLEGKTVVVVGGAGFVGQQLVKLLVSLDAKVYVLDDYSRDPTRSRLVKGAKYSRGRAGDDASHYSTCRSYFREAFAVFNLAAHVAGIGYNLNNQLEMLHRNTQLQLVPLAAAESVGVENYLQTSSVCVYSPSVQTGTPVKEDAGLIREVQKANKGYALAKRLGEEAAMLSSIANVVVVRPSNVAGPGDYYDEKSHVIPALVKRALTEPQIDVYGDPDVVREFIHPQDAAAGMIWALTAGKGHETYNIGNSANVVSIRTIAEMIRDQSGTGKEIVYHQSESGDLYRASDSSKLLAETGWFAKLGMENIIQSEIENYD